MPDPKPKPPPGLKARGKRFWTDVTGSFDLAPAESLLLAEACRVADVCEAMASATDAKTVTELRLQRLLLGRLIGQLQIPDADIADGKTLRARAGAEARWEGHIVKGGVE